MGLQEKLINVILATAVITATGMVKRHANDKAALVSGPTVEQVAAWFDVCLADESKKLTVPGTEVELYYCNEKDLLTAIRFGKTGASSPGLHILTESKGQALELNYYTATRLPLVASCGNGRTAAPVAHFGKNSTAVWMSYNCGNKIANQAYDVYVWRGSPQGKQWQQVADEARKKFGYKSAR